MPPGALYIVATPIGNLEDITLRALRTLREVDLIAAEDTRETRKLLAAHGITATLTSYHDYNKEEKAEVLLHRMRQGQRVALVTDSGTPLISDPGYYLLQRCIAEGVPVIPIPGPSAPIAALSVSGLAPDAFTFIGFLPRKPGKRRKRLEELRDRRETILLFESPYRVRGLLDEIEETLGDRRIVIAREMTKKFEEVLRGKVSELRPRVEHGLRGEITLLIEGKVD